MKGLNKYYIVYNDGSMNIETYVYAANQMKAKKLFADVYKRDSKEIKLIGKPVLVEENNNV